MRALTPPRRGRVVGFRGSRPRPDTATTAPNRAARAQALFDAVLRTRADVPVDVRIHCAAAVSVLGQPFPDVAAARDSTKDPLFGLEPSGAGVEAAVRAGLRELGLLPAAEFREVFRAAEAAHDALTALR